MDAKLIADRYISRGGGRPFPTRDEITSDLLAVARFIGWHGDGDLWGGHRASEAFDALCRLLNIDRIELRRVVRGEAMPFVLEVEPDPADDLPF